MGQQKKYRSDEGYVEDSSGNRNDSLFHGPILDNPEADRILAAGAIKRAIEGGMDPAMAEEWYGVP